MHAIIALISPTEAAQLLGIQPETLATWRSTQRYPLPYVKLGRSVRYRLEDLERFISERLIGNPDIGGDQND